MNKLCRLFQIKMLLEVLLHCAKIILLKLSDKLLISISKKWTCLLCGLLLFCIFVFLLGTDNGTNVAVGAFSTAAIFIIRHFLSLLVFRRKTLVFWGSCLVNPLESEPSKPKTWWVLNGYNICYTPVATSVELILNFNRAGFWMDVYYTLARRSS